MRSAAQDYLKRTAAVGLIWPVPEEISDDALEKRLFARSDFKTGQRRRGEPDWAELARELMGFVANFVMDAMSV